MVKEDGDGSRRWNGLKLKMQMMSSKKEDEKGCLQMERMDTGDGALVSMRPYSSYHQSLAASYHTSPNSFSFPILMPSYQENPSSSSFPSSGPSYADVTNGCAPDGGNYLI